MREREDDEIIEALNRYTLKLQTSLKVVKSFSEGMDGQIDKLVLLQKRVCLKLAVLLV